MKNSQLRNPRVETKIRAKIDGRDGDLEVFTGNLSKGGVFLETPEVFADVGEKVKLFLSMPNSTSDIKITGKVARIVGPNRVGMPQGLAVQFLRVEARQARLFEKFLDCLIDAAGIGCRKYPRAKTQVDVQLRFKDRSMNVVIADNLSVGGLFLRTSVGGLSLGDLINVVILHPGMKRKFMVDTEVVHIRQGESKIRKDFVEGVGVQFVDLSSSRRNDLSSFLKSVLAHQRKG